jgi:hypothetical protein
MSDFLNNSVSSADAGQLEAIAQLTFARRPYDLAAIPDNEQAAVEAVLDVSVFRLAAGLMQHDDTELEQIARQDLQPLVRLLELIGSQMNTKKHQLVTLECARTRLIVVLARVANGAGPLTQLSALDGAASHTSP